MLNKYFFPLGQKIKSIFVIERKKEQYVLMSLNKLDFF